MNEPLKTILLPNGKNAVEWTKRENLPLIIGIYAKIQIPIIGRLLKIIILPKPNKRIIRLSNIITGIFFIVVILSRRYVKLCVITHIGW